ncbi:MAG: putative bifunctional diguanylate cyclase/phosphodiesterase [Nitrospirota bacterium]
MSAAEPGQPAPDQHAPHRDSTARPRQGSARSFLPWHWLYFALAGFDLLTVVFGLYLSHRVTRIYTDSIAVNQQWARRLGQYDHLRQLASSVNAPGNDVFDSHNVVAERAMMHNRRTRFDADLAALRADLSTDGTQDAAALRKDLDIIDHTMGTMTAEAEGVFSLFERGQAEQAGEHMATMDRKYAVVQRAFSHLAEDVGAIQAANFQRQIRAAATVQRLEWLIGGFVLIMVVGATVYGHFLIKHAAITARQRELDARVRAELESEQRFRALIEDGNDVILLLDRALAVRYASPSFARVLGHDSRVAIGEPVSVFLHGDDALTVSTRCTRALEQSETGFSLVCRMRRADGEWLVMEVAGHASDGASVILTARDVTERNRAERALATSEHRYRELVQSIHELLAELAPDGTIRFVNATFCTVTGFSESELTGANWFDFLHPQDRAASRQPYEWLRSERRPIRHLEQRLRTRGGAYLVISTNCDPVADAAGQITAMAQVSFDLTAVREAEDTIRRLAYYDIITSLPNRTLLHDRLIQQVSVHQQLGKPLALLLIKVEHLKDINNTLGYRHGDWLLEQLAGRLTALARESDVVGRLGGADFAMVLPGTDLEGALRMSETVQESLASPLALEQLSLTVSASVGVAMFPDHAASADTLLQRAHVAVETAKRSHNKRGVYSPTQDAYKPRRLALASELRYAIDHNELTLFYQPKVALAHRTVVGVEALVRWRHPQRGLIPPDEFIPLAEHGGLIKPLTHWVLAAAREQATRWHAAGYRFAVAVNLSARTLHDPSLPLYVESLLMPTTGPSWLELEVTESTIMADPSGALNVLQALHALNIPLAIDDFGTGYSSLAYLQRLPVSAIKIDKSFVKEMASNPGDATIVRSTIDLAHNLGLTVIAEGVETADAWNQLAALRCDTAQGYFLSRPVPANELDAWFRGSGWRVDRDEEPPLAQAA